VKSRPINEFEGQVLEMWACGAKVNLSFIRPGKPNENTYIESFNGSQAFTQPGSLLSPYHVHGVRFREDLNLQRWRHRSRLGLASPRHGWRGEWRTDLRYFPATDTRRLEPLGRRPGRPAAVDLHRSVWRDARIVVRRQRGRSSDGLPESTELSDLEH